MQSLGIHFFGIIMNNFCKFTSFSFFLVRNCYLLTEIFCVMNSFTVFLNFSFKIMVRRKKLIFRDDVVVLQLKTTRLFTEFFLCELWFWYGFVVLPIGSICFDNYELVKKLVIGFDGVNFLKVFSFCNFFLSESVKHQFRKIDKLKSHFFCWANNHFCWL